MNLIMSTVSFSLLLLAAQEVPIDWTAITPDKAPVGWVATPPPSTEEEWFCANHSGDEWTVALRDDHLSISRFRDSPQIVLELSGGQLEGSNHGEFGGHIGWRDGRTKSVTEILKANPIGFHSGEAGIFAFVGLAHLSLDKGSVLKLKRDHNGIWLSSRILDLGTAPRAIFPYERDEDLVLTTRGVMTVDLRHSRKAMLFENRRWDWLYGHSILKFRDDIFVGARRAVLHLKPSNRGYSEEWWVRSECRKLEGEHCVCVQ